MVKAARALAAFLGRDTIDREVLAEAARYVLPHRLPTQPLESNADVARRIEDLIDGTVFYRAEAGNAAALDQDEDWDETERMQIPGGAAAGSLVLDYLVKKKTKNASSIPTR
jgi:magnesium chelatase subunit D/magnesium chelatase subunit I